MQIFHGIPPRALNSTVLTIGNFDGVHRGHQALLARLVTHARKVALPSAVMTFEPHPREFFAPDSAPARLTSLREKLSLIADEGVDHAYICRFNARFAALTAEQFIERILVQGLSVRHLIIGDDFRFGKGRAGDFEMLRRAGVEFRFGLEAMETVSVQGERVSSSALRDALQESDLAHAARLLGRPYGIAGRVIHGRKLGRELGFHTANIQLKRNRVPLAGVFAVRVSGEGVGMRNGVANLGMRPTVSNTLQPTLEVHLFDFDGDLYRHHLTVDFQAKLRDQAKFDSLQALSRQIGLDVAQARQYFAANERA
ncbi:MAG: riboflavin biosynthesis protein [Proteobacteria bacterium]|jgi:riboflavin kinase/FMN adenylyltransferase|nr:riboflavin biosynthesis protein [Pseudomonadota bacterium]